MQMQKAQFEVVSAESTGVYEQGCEAVTYGIRNIATGEVRKLEECILLDMDVFTEEDWDALLED